MRVSSLLAIIAVIAGVGYYLVQSGTWDKMRKDVDNSFSVHFTRGTNLYQTEKYPEAIAEFEKALAINPGDPDAATAMMRIGDCQKELKQLDKAIETYQRTLKEYPQCKQRGQIEQDIEKCKAGLPR